MSSLDQRLAALTRRLQSITQLPNTEDDTVDGERADMEPSKYICGECAWTTSTSARVLGRHFTLKHASRLKCPGCKSPCQDQEDLKKEELQKHRHLYPSCQISFPSGKNHDPCQSQQRAKVGEDTFSRILGRTIGGEAPHSVQRTHKRKSSVQSGRCPDPECELTFPDFNTLYNHYVGLHPPCITNHGQWKPFKCPFCSKRYHCDRFIPAHVRTHKPKALSLPGFGDAKDQEALIRQSHVAMANRKSPSCTNTQAEAGRAFSDEEVRCSVPKVGEGNFPLLIKEGFVYIYNGVEPESPTLEHSDEPNMQEHQRFDEASPIGLALQACPAGLSRCVPEGRETSVGLLHQTSALKPDLFDLMDPDDDYPEKFALNDDELPSKSYNQDSSIIAIQLCHALFLQSLSREIVRILQMPHFVNVNEVADLFLYFLDEYQRTYVLKEIGSINLSQDNNSILVALHGTFFKTLIDTWVDFKRLAIRYAPLLVRHANDHGLELGKSVIWALLQYCLSLENMISRKEVNTAHHFLRYPPRDDFANTAISSLPQLIAVLMEHVMNRFGHDSSLVFTKVMMLRGARDYVKILQMVFRFSYPITEGHEKLWRELRLI